MKEKKFCLEVRPTLPVTVSAKTYEEAVKKLKHLYKEFPVEVGKDLDDCEIYDVTPLPVKVQDELNRLGYYMECAESQGYPDGVLINNVHYEDEELGDLLRDNEQPKYVYADVTEIDSSGEGCTTTYHNAEYEIETLVEWATKMFLDKAYEKRSKK